MTTKKTQTLLLGWQWIFILEGLPTVLLCFVTIIYLPDYPQTAHFLSQDERDLAVKRLLVDAGPATQEEFSWRQARSVFVDWKVYMHAFPYILTMTPLYALALFLPTLVREFSFEYVFFGCSCKGRRICLHFPLCTST